MSPSDIFKDVLQLVSTFYEHSLELLRNDSIPNDDCIFDTKFRSATTCFGVHHSIQLLLHITYQLMT